MQARNSNVGRIKWFNPQRGFGVVTTLQGFDLFFSHTDLRCVRQETFELLANHDIYDTQVQYDVVHRRATNVAIITRMKAEEQLEQVF